jgi:hypothetical protein
MVSCRARMIKEKGGRHGKRIALTVRMGGQYHPARQLLFGN